MRVLLTLLTKVESRLMESTYLRLTYIQMLICNTTLGELNSTYRGFQPSM